MRHLAITRKHLNFLGRPLFQAFWVLAYLSLHLLYFKLHAEHQLTSKTVLSCPARRTDFLSRGVITPVMSTTAIPRDAVRIAICTIVIRITVNTNLNSGTGSFSCQLRRTQNRFQFVGLSPGDFRKHIRNFEFQTMSYEDSFILSLTETGDKDNNHNNDKKSDRILKGRFSLSYSQNYCYFTVKVVYNISPCSAYSGASALARQRSSIAKEIW